MIKIKYPIIVEGKYDKIKLSSLVSAHIYTTDGFRIFSDGERANFIRKIAENGHIIVLTDSDGAGLLIRNHIKNLLSPGSIINLYTPEIHGKEKRKHSHSASGNLGVEGVESEILLSLLAPYACGAEEGQTALKITKTDFFEWGLTGGCDSADKRKRLAVLLGLPTTLGANALIEAINEFVSADEFFGALDKIK